MKKKTLVLLVTFTLGAWLHSPTRSYSTLGEPAASIEADRKALSAVPKGSTVHDRYTVTEMSTAASTVREYVANSGIVFAIAWNGLNAPDLTRLLGPYGRQYREALGKNRRMPGRRMLDLHSDRLVVEEGGHMRNLRGRVYVPALIPPGVSVDDIQ